MGATLQYAKVVDGAHLQDHGGLAPSTDNLVMLAEDAPGPSRDFLILRRWKDATGAFTETWRIEDPYGQVIERAAERTVLPEHGELSDVLEQVVFQYPAPGYQLILQVEGREVARVDFEVVEPAQETESAAAAPRSEAGGTEAVARSRVEGH